MERRRFLSDITRYAALCAVVPNDWRVVSRPRYADDPFTLGVSSGDPTGTGAVLWTRLAPKPFEIEGGMDGTRPLVDWEVADDEAFTKVIKRGRYTAAPELGYSVHVEVEGLVPDRWFFYRFKSGEAVSQVGRVRTTPAAGALTPLRLGVASCQNYENGLYTALDHLSREQCDLVTHLGDYIYEAAARPGGLRPHYGREPRTVEQYRDRYSQYKLDPMLQAAHRMCPWLVVWDDHEVDNNYANDFGENGMESVEWMRARRAAAYQAWWEHQPVRVPRARSWADLDIRRTTNWGALARFWMLDTRQYRDDQACGDGTKVVPCGDNWANPARSLMGAQQEKWLFDGLGNSQSRWQVLGQQVPVAPWDSALGPETRLYMDGWSGYPANRDRLLAAVAAKAKNRTVVLTGDVHSNWVNELHAGFDRPDRETVAAEFVGTSLSSGGDGEAAWRGSAESMAENAHVKWHTARRGYMVCDVKPDAWTTEYREVAYISRPGAPVTTPSRWLVERNKPGINKL